MVEGLAVNWEGAVSIELDDEQMDMRTIIHIQIYSLTEKFVVAPNDESKGQMDRDRRIKSNRQRKKSEGSGKRGKFFRQMFSLTFSGPKRRKGETRN